MFSYRNKEKSFAVRKPQKIPHGTCKKYRTEGAEKKLRRTEGAERTLCLKEKKKAPAFHGERGGCV